MEEGEGIELNADIIIEKNQGRTSSCAIWGLALDYNSLKLRACALICGFVVGITTFFSTLGIVIVKSDSENPLGVCGRLGNATLTVKLKEGSAYLIIVIAGLGLAVTTIGALHAYLLGNCFAFLRTDFVTKPHSQRTKTAVFASSIIIYIIPNLFKTYNVSGFLVAIGLILWAFFLELYLQTKTPIGLFDCLVSVGVTIAFAVIECYPKTKWEWFLSALLLLGSVALFYYTAWLTKKRVCEIHIPGNIDPAVSPLCTVARVRGQELETMLRTSPSCLFHMNGPSLVPIGILMLITRKSWWKTNNGNF